MAKDVAISGGIPAVGRQRSIGQSLRRPRPADAGDSPRSQLQCTSVLGRFVHGTEESPGFRWTRPDTGACECWVTHGHSSHNSPFIDFLRFSAFSLEMEKPNTLGSCESPYDNMCWENLDLLQ